MVTSRCGPSCSRRAGSFSGEPILNSPAGTSANAIPIELAIIRGSPSPEWADAPGIKVIGRIAYDEMADLFRAADVTVSIPASDSSPRSVWEAMAAGSATVLSDLSWVDELIEDDRDALVVATEVEPVASAIERLIRDEALRRRIVSSARQLVEKHRDRKTELARVERCYLELTARSRK